jgi:hypothetical protein
MIDLAPRPAPTVPVATMAQTIVLLAFSRGEQPTFVPPTTRRALLRHRWLAPVKAPNCRYAITDTGRQALAASRHLAKAQRVLDEGKAAATKGPMP